MSDNRKSFTPMDMLTSGGNGDVGCATPFGYVTARYQGGEIVCVTVDEERFVPESGQGVEPSGWLNKRGEILSADQKARLIESGGIVAASIRTNFTIPLYTHPQPAQQGSVPEPVPDNCLSAKIGEVGNQIHNLGCEHQNDEDLSDRLGKLAAVLWDLAGDAPKQPAKQEWDGEGLPPVGVECRMTLGFVEYDHVKITYMGDGVFCYLNKRTELEYTGALCDATFRPLKTQHERQRDSLAELCRTKFNQQTSSSNPYLWRQIADAILSRYTLEPKP